MNKFLLKMRMAAAEEEGTVDGMPGADVPVLDDDAQDFVDMMTEIEGGGAGPVDQGDVADSEAENKEEPEDAGDAAAEEEAPATEEPAKGTVPETPVTPEQTPEPEPAPGVDPAVAEQQRQDFLTAVEKSFEISEDDANMLLTEPEKVLPRLGASIYERTMRDVAHFVAQERQMLMQALPQVITQTQTATTQEEAARNTFLEVNPGLDVVGNLNELVQGLAPTVMQANPGKSGTELMQILGSMIYPMVGMSRPAAAAPAAETPITPKPHVPAAISTPSATVQTGIPEGEDPIITELLAMDN